MYFKFSNLTYKLFRSTKDNDKNVYNGASGFSLTQRTCVNGGVIAFRKRRIAGVVKVFV